MVFLFEGRLLSAICGLWHPIPITVQSRGSFFFLFVSFFSFIKFSEFLNCSFFEKREACYLLVHFSSPMASTKESGGYPILAGPRVNDHFECLELREERICLKESEMKNKKR